MKPRKFWLTILFINLFIFFLPPVPLPGMVIPFQALAQSQDALLAAGTAIAAAGKIVLSKVKNTGEKLKPLPVPQPKEMQKSALVEKQINKNSSAVTTDKKTRSNQSIEQIFNIPNYDLILSSLNQNVDYHNLNNTAIPSQITLIQKLDNLETYESLKQQAANITAIHSPIRFGSQAGPTTISENKAWYPIAQSENASLGFSVELNPTLPTPRKIMVPAGCCPLSKEDHKKCSRMSTEDFKHFFDEIFQENIHSVAAINSCKPLTNIKSKYDQGPYSQDADHLRIKIMEQLNLWQFYNFMDLIRDFPEFPSFVLGLEKQLKDKEFKKLIDTVPGFNVQFHHKWAQGLIKSHQDIHQLRNFIKKESQDVIEKQIQQIKQVEENKRGNWYKTETSKTKTTKEVKSQQDLNNKTNTIQKEIGELRSIFKESPHIEKFDKIINKIIQTNCETSFDDQILIVNFGEKLLEVAKKTACIIHQTHDKSEVLNSQIATELFSTYHDASIALSKILLSKNDSFQDYEQMLSETINEKKIDFISLTAFDKEPQISQLINDEIAETEKINTQNNLTYQKVLTPLQEIFSNSIQICHEAIKQEKINQTYQTMFTQRNNWLDLHTKAKQAHEEQIEEIQQYNPVQNLKSKIKKLTKRILKDAIAEPNQNSNKKELEKAQMLELENLVEIFTNILGKKTATDYEKELAKLGLDLTTDAIDAIEEKNIKSYKNIKSKVSTILKTLRVDENKIKKEKDYVLAKEAIYQLEKLEFNLENFVTFEGDSFQSYLHDQTINIINNTSDIFAAYLNDSNINSISSLIYSLLEKSTKCNQNQEIEDSFNLVDYSQKLLTLEQKIALAIQEEDIENIQTKNISTKTITPFIEMVEYPLDTSKSFEKEMEEATLAHCKISHLLNDINLENISAPPLEKIFLDSNEISKNFKDFSNEADIFYGCENVDEKSIKVSGSKFSPPMPDPEDPEDPKNKLKKKIDKILEKTKPGKKTKGPTKQFEKPGNYDDALRDFEKLNPKDVRFDGDTKIGKLSNGKHANVRPSSSKPNPRPTLEIQNGNKTIKIRYIG